jgi:large subunit ribosomal protein L23
MLKPIFTEKSLESARRGKYSFWVDSSLTKSRIKSEISGLFDVHVTSIKTVLGKSESRRNLKGRRFTTKTTKKAVVTLKEGEKIDIFEETKKK